MEVMAQGFRQPIGTAVADAEVYFVEMEAGTVNKMAVDGGAIVTLVRGAVRPIVVKLDDTYAYFRDVGNGTVTAPPSVETRFTLSSPTGALG